MENLPASPPQHSGWYAYELLTITPEPAHGWLRLSFRRMGQTYGAVVSATYGAGLTVGATIYLSYEASLGNWLISRERPEEIGML